MRFHGPATSSDSMAATSDTAGCVSATTAGVATRLSSARGVSKERSELSACSLIVNGSSVFQNTTEMVYSAPHLGFAVGTSLSATWISVQPSLKTVAHVRRLRLVTDGCDSV